MPGPIVLLGLPLVAATVVYLVRRWAFLAAPLSAAATTTLTILCLRLPLDRSAFVLGQEVAFGRPIVILGLDLVLNAQSQAWLAFVFALATAFYLFAWRLSQGWSFFPFSLVILSLYALVALLQPFAVALIVFAISGTLAAVIIQGGRTDSVRGAQRYLVIMVLAVPLILGASWLADHAPPAGQNLELARQALLPAAFGFGLLLAAIPFGTWMPALAADAPPIVTAFIFTAGQGMAIFLIMVFLQDHTVVFDTPVTPAVLQLIGLMMAGAGGLMAAVQRDFGRLFGYAAISDLGYFFLAWGTGSSQSLTLALLHMLNRAVPIVLMASALAVLRHRATTDAFTGLRGVAYRQPISVAGLALGGLALAGFPLTAGFPTHWAVSRALLNGQWAWNEILPLSLVGLVLLGSSAGIVAGLLRGLSAMLGDEPRPEMGGQPVIASIMILALTALAIAVGLYPQLFLQQAMALF